VGRTGLKTRHYDGAEKAAGLKPHPYNGSEKGADKGGEKAAGLKTRRYIGSRGSAANAWEMLARASYVVNGNAADGGSGALNGHREN